MRTFAAFASAAVLSLACACRSTPDHTPPTTLTLASPLSTSTAPAPLSISVEGTAEIETVPDQFIVTVLYEARRPDPQTAKRDCDEATRGMLAATKTLKIDPRDVQTQDFWLGPHYDHDDRGDLTKLLGYDVRKTLVVTVRDPDAVEPLLASLFSSGATSLTSVDFVSSKQTELRKQARSDAALAARDKADAMLRAAAPGQKLGRALKIEEQYAGGWSGPNVNVANVNHEAPSVLVRETMAAGKIRIVASTSVTYELVDA